MPRRDPQPVAVREGLDRRWLKHAPLLVQMAHQAVGDASDLFAAKDSYQAIDLGPVGEQIFLLPSARQPETITPRVRPLAFKASISSIAANDSVRARSMKPQVLTTTKSAPSGSNTRS